MTFCDLVDIVRAHINNTRSASQKILFQKWVSFWIETCMANTFSNAEYAFAKSCIPSKHNWIRKFRERESSRKFHRSLWQIRPHLHTATHLNPLDFLPLHILNDGINWLSKTNFHGSFLRNSAAILIACLQVFCSIPFTEWYVICYSFFVVVVLMEKTKWKRNMQIRIIHIVLDVKSNQQSCAMAR